MIVEEDDKLYEDFTEFLICISFMEIQRLNSEIGNLNFYYSHLLGHNVSVSIYLNYSLTSVETYLNVSNLFQLKKSYLLCNFPCFLTTKDELNKDLPLYGLFNHYETFIYPFFKNRQTTYNQIIYETKRSYNLDGVQIKKQKVYNDNYLLDLDCINDDSRYDKNCLNHCLEKYIEYANFGFYDYANDYHKIEMINYTDDYDENSNETLANDNQLSDEEGTSSSDDGAEISKKEYENFKNCYEKCSKDSCSYETFNCQLTNKSTDNKLIVRTSVYKAYFTIDDFWIQLIGLILFFVDNCLINILFFFAISILRRFKKIKKNKYFHFLLSRLKTNRHRYFRLFNSKIKFIGYILFVIFFVTASLSMYSEYDLEKNYPNKTAFVNFSNEIPALIACFPVSYLLNGHNLSGTTDQQLDLTRNLTFNDIESLTDGKIVNNNIIRYVKFGYVNQIREEEFKWTISKEVLFRSSEFSGLSCLSRCFRINFKYIKKLRYEMLNPFYYLIIKFDEKYPRKLYLIDRDQKFTSNLSELDNFESIRKVTKVNSLNSKKAKCTDYSGLNCTSSYNCLIKCINENFAENYFALSTYSIIDKSDLNLDYSKITFDSSLSKYIRFKRHCLEIYKSYRDCNQIYYEESFKKIDNLDGTLINLNYENYYELEKEPSLVKTLLNILNLESIIFGTNIISLLSDLSSLFVRRKKLKWIRFFIYLICGFGLFVHFSFIFKGIIDEELLHSVYFQKLDSYGLPKILICFDIEERIKNKIDQNYKLNGHLLNSKTTDLNLQNLTQDFYYFNKTHYIFPEASGYNFSSPDLSLSFSFINSLKCLEIELKINDFNLNDFLYIMSKFLITIGIDKLIEMNDDFQFVNLLYKQPGTNQFSDILRYSLKDHKYINGEKINRNLLSLEMTFELTEIERYDRFEYLKNPKILFYKSVKLNDPTVYLNNLKSGFEELTNLTTRNILLNDIKDNFKLEIDDEIFAQYYMQVNIKFAPFLYSLILFFTLA